jgi:O-antigen ligase
MSFTETASGVAAEGRGRDARPGALASRLEGATAVCLFLFATAAPHSIAAAQTAWLLGLLCWVARYFVRPRPRLWRTPVDYALLGFFILTFLTALTSYAPDISVGKLRAASLFTIIYLTAENVRSRRVLRALAVVLVASCAVGLVHTFGVFAVGRGVKVTSLAPDSPLRAAGVREGDTLLSADGAALRTPADLAGIFERKSSEAAGRAAANAPESGGGAGANATGSDGGAVAQRPSVKLQYYRLEGVYTAQVPLDSLPAGATPETRLGIGAWSRGRDERAQGTYDHYTTYAEALQLVASLAIGLLFALPRKKSARGLLLSLAAAGMCGALLLTVTRASWAGLLVSVGLMAFVGAGRRTLFFVAALALPLVVAAAFVLQQKRQIGFVDPREGSTAWRLMVWRESAHVLASSPRHLLVGVGMDSLKRYYRQWGLFDSGRQNVGHLHSTPLQIAFERGLPALFVWLAFLYIYARTLWRLARGATAEWFERGLALGALGGLAGFLASGLVHYNFGDSEVVMIFYFVAGLALAAERLVSRHPTQAGVTEVASRG